ncbi:hypothetical protein [Catellatospora sp. NPDC049609]|uniref:hypothetical protein n=1 Tax=Catellatospora sp. NPDC049609 TaxID=3155505 RepID=UPI0034415EF4
MSRGPAVIVEVIALSAQAGTLHYRDLRTPVTGGAHPDDVARQLVGLSPCTEGGLLHSTSWRVEGGAVVLTYAALPDLRPEGTRPVQLDAVSTGSHPLTPSPLVVELDAVAAHACRHLAMLAVTDATVEAAARRLPQLWEPIGKLAPGLAGALTAVAV